MDERMSLWGPVAVAGLCALLLSLTYLATEAPIAENQHAHNQRLLRELLATSLPEAELNETLRKEAAWQNDQLVWCAQGIVVSRLVAKGYAGPIEILLAWRTPQAVVIGVRISRHLETPGIADFLNERGPGTWLNGFRQSTVADISKIDAVTGATISSQAVTAAVTASLQMPVPTVSGCAE